MDEQAVIGPLCATALAVVWVGNWVSLVSRESVTPYSVFLFSIVLTGLGMGILLCLCLGRRGDQPSAQFSHRDLSSLNFFKRRVEVCWPEDWTASNTKVIRFLLGSLKDVRTEIRCLGEVLASTHLFEQGELQLVFPAKRAGEYKIALWVAGREVRSSPWTQHVWPGTPHPPMCRVVGPWGAGRGVVVPLETQTQSVLQIRDTFGNIVNCSSQDCENVHFEGNSSSNSSFSTTVFLSPGSPDLTLIATFFRVGCYPWKVKYLDHVITTTQILVLVPDTIRSVEESLRDISNFSWNSYYSANLTKLAGIDIPKPRAVYIYLKEKQLIVKEYFLKIIPKRVISFRINPKVAVSVAEDNTTLVISQSDNDGSETVMTGPDVLSLAAAYYLILAKRLGGTESFAEKREHFYSALQKYHAREKGHKHVKIHVIVQRSNIFESTFRATRYFLESDWARLFEIKFEGEEGHDQGGLRREWMETITRHVFDHRNGMFVPLEEGGPGLQPNPFPPSHIKLKHYRLAGKLVGKCLYESSCGKTYRMNLNAQLAKSFLTQIIGIDVSYTLLEFDAPLLYTSKVKYILENSVAGLDLTFTQEENKAGHTCSQEICPCGSYKSVTDENKRDYIYQLAKYLMVDRVQKQVQAFIEGVHTLVPGDLLTLWDEGELELLLCGIRQYNIDQLKLKHAIVGTQTFRFSKVLNWFWEALHHFSNEDMARFVQFVTGSSLLPPGGWAELSPILQISFGGEKGSLPTSHTCFNLLVLPDAENYQKLERVLMLAVREGSEGFMMA